jgi:hypothetical protein
MKKPMRKEALMRSNVSLRLRLVAGAVAAATVVAVGVVSAPPAGAATRSHPHIELSTRPAVDKTYSNTGLLCDFDHKSWCVGHGPVGKTHLSDGEMVVYGFYMAAFSFVVTLVGLVARAIIKFRRWWHKGGGGHERPYFTGDCLTQSAGQVVFAKCAKGTKGAAVTSQTWRVEYVSNGSEGLVNQYWLSKGKSLWLTEPAKIVEGGLLRLHTMFGVNTGGFELQEWYPKPEKL